MPGKHRIQSVYSDGSGSSQENELKTVKQTVREM